MSCDPILGDYLSVAPISDEAKKHNSRLPGQGGVFNPINFALYHYSENNPLIYTDPNGNADAFAQTVQAFMSQPLSYTPLIPTAAAIGAEAWPVLAVAGAGCFCGFGLAYSYYLLSIEPPIPVDACGDVGGDTIDIIGTYSKKKPFDDHTRGPNFIPVGSRLINPTGKYSNLGPEKIPDPSDPGNLDPKTPLEKFFVIIALIAKGVDKVFHSDKK